MFCLFVFREMGVLKPSVGKRPQWDRGITGSGHTLSYSTNSIHWEIWRVFKGFLAVDEGYSLCLGVDNVAVKVTGKGTGSPGEEC